MDRTYEGQDSAPYEDGDYSTGTVADYDDDWSPRAPITAPMCPVCPTGHGVSLGTLGILHWFRCRLCGIDFNRKVA